MTPEERAAYDAETERLRLRSERSWRIAERLALGVVVVQLGVLAIRIAQALGIVQ